MIINFLAVGLVLVVMNFLHGEALNQFFIYSSVGFMSLGVLFFFGTTIGVLRFPDFYTRMHAAVKGDTLSSMLILIGAALYSLHGHHHITLGTALVAVKILIIMNFIFIGSPTATHAMMNAGNKIGAPHWEKTGKKKSI